MSLAGILTGAIAVVAAISGIREVTESAPEQPPAIVPAAWLGDGSVVIASGTAQMWTWSIPLTVAVVRKGVLSDERAVSAAYIKPVVDAFSSNLSLGGACIDCHVTEIRLGPIGWAGQEATHYGFTATLLAKEKFNVSYSG